MVLSGDFFQNYLFQIFLQEHYQSVRQSGGLDLGPNCLQRLSADDKIYLNLFPSVSVVQFWRNSIYSILDRDMAT